MKSKRRSLETAAAAAAVDGGKPVEPHPEATGSRGAAVCYCGGERQLGTLELHCNACKQWFHSSCLKDLTEMCGLPFMVCYNFHCRNCSPTKKETWELKTTHFPHMALMALANMTFNHHGGNPSATEPTKYFHIEKDIVPYFETNWENLTSQKTFSKEDTLFMASSSDPENAFALKERDLLAIGPLHDAVKQIGKRSTQQPSEVQVQNKPEDFTGPKTRGASKRRVLEGGSFATPTTAAKRGKSSADGSCATSQAGGTDNLQYPFNRDGYRYYLVEKDGGIENRAAFDADDLSTAARTIPSFIYRVVNPPVVTISPNDRAHQLKVAEDHITVVGSEGYSIARATHSVSHGKWYFEVDFLDQPADSHTRIGWSQAPAVLQACLGYSKFSYSWRSLKGTAFHDARGVHYADGGYCAKDTLGCLIDLPELADICDTIMPITEDGGSSAGGCNAAAMTTFSDFLPPSFKENSLISYRHKMFFEEKEEELPVAAKKLKVLKGAKIEFYKNGRSCGVAFHNIYAGHYFPAVSIFKNATLRMNFGPNFKYPPKTPVRGMWERAVNIPVEQCLSDVLFLANNREEIEQKTREYFDNATA